MRATNIGWGIAALSVMTASVLAGDVDYTKYDKMAWLDQKSWPALAAHRPVKIADKDDAEVKLLKERYNAAQQELRTRYIHWLQEHDSLPQVYGAAKRAIEARLEMEGLQANRIEVLKEKVAFARVVEQQAKTLDKEFRGAGMSADKSTATYFRSDAELELLRAVKAAKGATSK